MNMAMSQQIAKTKSHHQVHLQDKEIPTLTQDTMIDPLLAMTIKTGTITMTFKTDIDLTGRDPILTVIDTGVHSQSNSWRSHSRSYHRPTHHSTSCHRNSSTYCHQRDTPHRRPRDCSRSRLHISHKNNCITSSKPSSSSNRTIWKNKDRKYKQVTIDDPPSKYYSSDEPSSKSDEDLN